MADVLYCKRCGGQILVTGYCSQCGLKSEYVNKAINTSKFYYNIGLDKAKVRDMTGAAAALTVSLKYDKMNIDARNLLGLVYYETGKVVEALNEWVISVNLFDGRNVAKRYIKEVKANPHKLEATNNVARKYNQALNYARQGSKDLAFIQLRKVLSDNGKFVDGYLLFALLNIDAGRYDKAKKALKRVIKIDRTNPLAVRYFNEMGVPDSDVMDYRDFPEDDYDADILFTTDEPHAYVETGKPLAKADDSVVPVGHYKDINFYKYSMAYVIAGIVLGVAVMFFLVMPQRQKSNDNTSKELKITFSEQIADKNVKISSLENEVKSIQSELDQANATIDDYKANSKILSNEDKVSMQLAVKKYIDGDYEGALTSFEKLMETNENYDELLFYAGLCYEKLGQYENAVTAFTNLTTNCPDSIYYTVASTKAKTNNAAGDGVTDTTTENPYSEGGTGDGTDTGTGDGTGDGTGAGDGDSVIPDDGSVG